MKALVFHELGDPNQVLRLEEIEEVKPAQDEVLLQMLFSRSTLQICTWCAGATATSQVCPPVPRGGSRNSS